MGDASPRTDAVPVTVLCGPLGAGKTTLVNRLLEDPGGRRVAVLVNDVGDLNVDAELIRGRTDEGVIDLSNGCICCRLQDDLVSEATRLAREREFDYLLVEASGVSEPIPIARALATPGADGDPDPTERLRLDTVVAVVDAYGFWRAFDPAESLPDGVEPERPLAEVMVDQIEFCDVLLLNKCDMVPDEELDAVAAAVRELQPSAAFHRTTHCDVPPDVVLATGRFDFDSARRAPGWRRALARDDGETEERGTGRADGRDDGDRRGHEPAEDHGHEPAEDHGHEHGHGDAGGHAESAAARHGVNTVLYERSRPFHPGRLDAWLDDWDGDVVRAKGFCWVASRPTQVVGLSRAGAAVQVGPIGEWDDDEPATRLVFIGYDLDGTDLSDELDACLATDGELEVGLDADADPFPRES